MKTNKDKLYDELTEAFIEFQWKEDLRMSGKKDKYEGLNRFSKVALLRAYANKIPEGKLTVMFESEKEEAKKLYNNALDEVIALAESLKL